MIILLFTNVSLKMLDILNSCNCNQNNYFIKSNNMQSKKNINTHDRLKLTFVTP